MHEINKTTLWVLVLIGSMAFLGASGRVSVAGVDIDTARVDEIFSQLNRTDSPGCAVALVNAGAIAFSKGYGMANLEQGAPIRPDTVFYAGSVSKQFVAFSVALLAESGKLSLDDNIRKYLPEIRDYGKPITIRHLIYHTSGLRDYLELWGIRGRSVLDTMIESEVLDLIARQQELNFPPGERHLYSNSGYFLLSVIIERIAGVSLKEFAEREIFGPLGMRSSHFHDDQTHLIRHKAESYFPRDDGNWGVLTQRFALVGSGGLYTSVEDLARWDGNFYDNKLGLDGRGLIDSTLETGTLNDGTRLDYAFGLFVGEFRGLATISHGGALGGYRAHLLRFPERRFSVILMCNHADADPAKLAERVAELVLFEGSTTGGSEAVPTNARPEPETAVDAADVAPLTSYTGDYTSPELDSSARLFLRSGTLWLQFGYARPTALRQVREGVFEDGQGRTVEFEPGQPDRFRLQAGRVRNLLFVAK